MTLKCSYFYKSLSTYLDGELDPQEHERIEKHIAHCSKCRDEVERLKEIMGILKGMPAPELPTQLWELTRRRVETASEKTSREWGFRIPKWSFAPVGVVVFALLVLLVGSQIFYKTEIAPPTVDTFIQEHILSSSDRIMPPDLLSELTVAQTVQVIEDTGSNKNTSELDMLMEVHYGIISENGS